MTAVAKSSSDFFFFFTLFHTIGDLVEWIGEMRTADSSDALIVTIFIRVVTTCRG